MRFSVSKWFVAGITILLCGGVADAQKKKVEQPPASAVSQDTLLKETAEAVLAVLSAYGRGAVGPGCGRVPGASRAQCRAVYGQRAGPPVVAFLRLHTDEFKRRCFPCRKRRGERYLHVKRSPF